jgi:phosphoglycerate dehydrogenase-like enzyme
LTRVLFHYQATPELARRLHDLRVEGIDVCVVAPDDDAALERELPKAEVLWHVLAPADVALIAAAPKLRLIQKWGVGLNTIDLVAARARGIQVSNMPGTNSRAVAELTLLLMLASLRRLSTIETDFRSGRWAVEPDILGAQGELGGRTVGLVGMGAVPTLLAPMLTAMGAKPCYWSRSARAGLSLPYLSLPELLASADIVSLHLPLTNETVGIIDVWSMKKGSILINTARGGLVDEAQLVAALSSKHLAAAGLDVFEAEPISADHPLLALGSVTATPHVAWLTAETLLRSLDFAVLNLRNLAAGRPILCRIE